MINLVTGVLVGVESYPIHFFERLYWKLANPDNDWDDCPHRLKLPYYLEHDPKSIVVFDALIYLKNPIEFIAVDINIEYKEEK